MLDLTWVETQRVNPNSRKRVLLLIPAGSLHRLKPHSILEGMGPSAWIHVGGDGIYLNNLKFERNLGPQMPIAHIPNNQREGETSLG